MKLLPAAAIHAIVMACALCHASEKMRARLLGEVGLLDALSWRSFLHLLLLYHNTPHTTHTYKLIMSLSNKLALSDVDIKGKKVLIR